MVLTLVGIFLHPARHILHSTARAVTIYTFTFNALSLAEHIGVSRCLELWPPVVFCA